MSDAIEELLESLLRKLDDATQEANRFERLCLLLEAEIRGVRAAQNLLTLQAGNGAEPPKQRRPRRDIKALVRTYLDQPRPFILPADQKKRAAFIADQIGDCRLDQVVKAIAAIDVEDGT